MVLVIKKRRVPSPAGRRKHEKKIISCSMIAAIWLIGIFAGRDTLTSGVCFSIGATKTRQSRGRKKLGSSANGTIRGGFSSLHKKRFNRFFRYFRLFVIRRSARCVAS